MTYKSELFWVERGFVAEPVNRRRLGLFIAATYAARIGATLSYRPAGPHRAVFELSVPLLERRLARELDLVNQLKGHGQS